LSGLGKPFKWIRHGIYSYSSKGDQIVIDTLIRAWTAHEKADTSHSFFSPSRLCGLTFRLFYGFLTLRQFTLIVELILDFT